MKKKSLPKKKNQNTANGGGSRGKAQPKSWRQRALQPDIVIATSVGVGLIIATIVGSVLLNRHSTEEFQRTHRPKIIFSRPAEVRFVKCDTSANGENSGELNRPRIWLENTGSSETSDAFLAEVSPPQLVPVENASAPRNPNLQPITRRTCEHKFVPALPTTTFPIYAGKEIPFDNLVGTGFGYGPPLGRAATVQLYWPLCVAYSDEYGVHHVTCETFFFSPSNSDDSANFVCTGKPLTGTFERALAGNCES